MAYALVANTIKQSADGTGVTSNAIDTSGADLLVLALAYFGPAGYATPTDSKSNTWLGPDFVETSSPAIALFYAQNATVGSGHTFAATKAFLFPSISIAAFSGSHLTSPHDQTSTGTQASGTTVLPGSITPSENNELVVSAMAGQPSGATMSINSGMTIADQAGLAPGVAYGVALAYIIQTTAGAINPTWTSDSSSQMAAVIASYKVPGAAAGWGPLLAMQRNRLVAP